MLDAESRPHKNAFDIAYENLQSISRAQRFYLSVLLVYLCAVWGWYFVGGGAGVTVQMVGITLQTGGLWIITPAVTTLMTLALVGSVNAAGPGWRRLKNAATAEMDLPEVRSGLVFYNIDTHKNIFDYFTFLRIHPERPLDEDSGRRFELRHFLYPLLYAVSIWTTWMAVSKAYTSADATGGLVHPMRFLTYGVSCLFFQAVFSVRPWWRAVCRFLGVRKQHAYDASVQVS